MRISLHMALWTVLAVLGSCGNPDEQTVAEVNKDGTPISVSVYMYEGDGVAPLPGQAVTSEMRLLDAFVIDDIVIRNNGQVGAEGLSFRKGEIDVGGKQHLILFRVRDADAFDRLCADHRGEELIFAIDKTVRSSAAVLQATGGVGELKFRDLSDARDLQVKVRERNEPDSKD